jgi:hypothetical protein
MVDQINESDTRPVSPRLRPGVLSVFAGVSCYLALVQVLTIAASVTRLQFSQGLAVAIAALSLPGAVVFATRFFEPEGNPGEENKTPPGLIARFVRILTGLSGAAVIVWGAWVWVELWMLAWLRPPYDWDGLYYHLPAIHEWATAGRVCFVGFMPNVPFVNFPMAVELNTYFAHYLLGTSRLVNACNLWYWPLAFLALVVIAKRLGARGVWPWVAGALIAGVPVFVGQSVSCYVDPGFAAAVMGAIAASLVFVFDGGRSRGWNAVLLGLLIGLALGAKGTGLPFAVVILVGVMAGVARVHGFGQWKPWLLRVMLVIPAILAVGGYWYIRNAAQTGNPIFPIQLKIGEKVVFEGWDHNLFNDANLPVWLEKHPGPLRMFVSWTQPDAPIHGSSPVGGLGYIWLAGCVPAFLLMWLQMLRRKGDPRNGEFVLLTILVLGLLAVQPASWWSRFTVWLLALGLPCLAVVMTRAVYGWRRNPWHLVSILFVAGIFTVAVWETGRTLQLEWADGRTSETAGVGARFSRTVDYLFPEMADTDGFREFLAADAVARGPWDGYATLLGGVLGMPLGERTVVVLPFEPAESDIEDLHSRGIEWVLWDVINAGDVPPVLTANTTTRYVHNPDPGLHFVLLRIRP